MNLNRASSHDPSECERSFGSARVLFRVGVLVALASFGACDLNDDSQCVGDVEVTCDDEGCECASGDAQGESCSEDADAPDSCEVVCCEGPF